MYTIFQVSALPLHPPHLPCTSQRELLKKKKSVKALTRTDMAGTSWHEVQPISVCAVHSLSCSAVSVTAGTPARRTEADKIDF